VRQVRGRCVMTTYDPDTLEQDISVLQKIVFELGGRTALDGGAAAPIPRPSKGVLTPCDVVLMSAYGALSHPRRGR
jgi:hypothetical protein